MSTDTARLAELLFAMDDKLDTLLKRIEAPSPTGTSLTAADVAERLGVDRKWIYGHAAELGARRLPSAKGQGRLRFDHETVEQAMRRLQSETPAQPKPKPQKQTEASANVELLPIRGGESR
jgi:hypothetical protein